MSFFCVCSFDLKNASSEDYKNVYADLDAMGLKSHVVGSNNLKIVLPNTTTAGLFNGSSAQQVASDLRSRVDNAMRARGLTFELFLSAGGADWGWSYNSNKPA